MSRKDIFQVEIIDAQMSYLKKSLCFYLDLVRRKQVYWKDGERIADAIAKKGLYGSGKCKNILY